ncbi:peroxiredoxin [Sulfurihydrogenibium subterraneum]|uniref:peroxiredoxin n=1 Tax=Sulfurihydrogenibium subterraneum TaxID=171121 RepID=UPI0004921C76|nr:peroxiredoxin [Sulfurihydrogenibium subterraneum]
MKNFILSILTFIGLATAGKPISEGQPAYNFSLTADDGKIVKLEDYKGKWVVLYFYPKADTPGCTTQAKEYTKLMPEFEKRGIVVFGISTDDVEDIKKFKQKHNLKVKFLSDLKGEVAKAYDVPLIFGLCSRNTIIINPVGKVEKIYRGVDPSADAKNVLNYISSKL